MKHFYGNEAHIYINICGDFGALLFGMFKKRSIYHLYGMFNIWQKLSAFPIISSISFQLSSSWGEQITNCSTLEKEESKVNNETATDLFKLMHPEDTPGVPSMAAHLDAR